MNIQDFKSILKDDITTFDTKLLRNYLDEGKKIIANMIKLDSEVLSTIIKINAEIDSRE